MKRHSPSHAAPRRRSSRRALPLAALALTPALLSAATWSALASSAAAPQALSALLPGLQAPLLEQAPLVAVPAPDTPAAAPAPAPAAFAPATARPPEAAVPATAAALPTAEPAAVPPAGAQPSATPVSNWTEPIKASPKPEAEAVLDDAPARGPVNLVTVREVDGRPVVSTVSAADLAGAEKLVDRALADPGVLTVSVASTVRALAADPSRPQQWALDRLAAEQVWARQNGAGTVVAVVDTGVAAHPDLAGVVLNGKDYISGGTGRVDPHGHGTHVAGIIAAVANNGIGIAGLAQGVRILPVRVLDATGAGSDATVANGIVWAADQGAAVINLSVGSPDNSPAEAAAVAYATQRGAVVVSATGNNRAGGNPVMYPAALPGVLGVGASTKEDRVAGYSGSGSYVDVAAPGTGILSTYQATAYRTQDGTSMACAYASAAAALVKAAAPRLGPAEVMNVLQRSARDLETAGRDNLSGYGLIQPVAAIALARTTAGGSAIPPGGTGSPLRATTLAVVSAPTRVNFRATATLTYRLTAGSTPLIGAVVSICTATAPSTRATCVSRSTDAKGVVSTSTVVLGHLTVSARYGGSARDAASVARPVLIQALPQATIRAGVRAVTLTVAPTATGTSVRVQRLVGSTWTTVITRAAPASGQLTVTGLVSKATYRVAIPATDRTIAATTSSVVVR